MILQILLSFTVNHILVTLLYVHILRMGPFPSLECVSSPVFGSSSDRACFLRAGDVGTVKMP